MEDNKQIQIIESAFDTGWKGCAKAAEIACDAHKVGVRQGKRKGLIAGLLIGYGVTSVAFAAKNGAFDWVKNLFKPKHEDDLDDFEVDDDLD